MSQSPFKAEHQRKIKWLFSSLAQSRVQVQAIRSVCVCVCVCVVQWCSCYHLYYTVQKHHFSKTWGQIAPLRSPNRLLWPWWWRVISQSTLTTETQVSKEEAVRKIHNKINVEDSVKKYVHLCLYAYVYVPLIKGCHHKLLFLAVCGIKMYRLQECLSTCLATLVPEVYFPFQSLRVVSLHFSVICTKPTSFKSTLIWSKYLWKLGTKVGINVFNGFNEGILKNMNMHLLLIYIDKRLNIL